MPATEEIPVITHEELCSLHRAACQHHTGPSKSLTSTPMFALVKWGDLGFLLALMYKSLISTREAQELSQVFPLLTLSSWRQFSYWCQPVHTRDQGKHLVIQRQKTSSQTQFYFQEVCELRQIREHAWFSILSAEIVDNNTSKLFYEI